jgi:hypothetical protein
MKFLRFTMMDAAKVAEVSKVSDKMMANLPPGYKMHSLYACLGIPFPGAPANAIVAVSVLETDSSEALTATGYPLTLAGASVWDVPVLEMPVGGAVEVEKKLRG